VWSRLFEPDPTSKQTLTGSFVDWHLLDADSNQTFHFDAVSNPDSGPDPTSSYKQIETLYFFTFISSIASFNCFIFLISVIGDIIFSILDSIFEFLGKRKV
jgi:hypothetical protein